MLLLCLIANGCAIKYYDEKSGTEHLWGFGHLKMRAVPRRGESPVATNGVMAFVTGVKTLGVSLGAGREMTGVTAGWDSRARLTVQTEDSSFYLLWPTNSIWLPFGARSLFDVRVGPEFPFTNAPAVIPPNTKSPP